ncbi:hypothetical protein CO192_01425 [Halopseudomonas pelagia]|uniref:Helicase n=1 Tax=Halopseudomonas pelagia TaxID=553151 RepID=A0AA91U6W9_9GAMM|nr:hypothetical protein CO192_01425 [Halopseudomonas pelagia]
MKAVCKSVTITGMTGHVRRNTHLAQLSELGIGIVDNESISRHSFVRSDGCWNFDFAELYRRKNSALNHQLVRPSGVTTKLSDHQIRLINNIQANQEDSIEAQAYAGTGKTFVLDEIMARMPDRKFIFLADVEPKLRAIRDRFPKERLKTSTFKRLAESLLSNGSRALQIRMVEASRLTLSYSGLAERASLSGIGSQSATQVAAICWAAIFKFCMSKDPQITLDHIPLLPAQGYSNYEKQILIAAATTLWVKLSHWDLEAPLLPIRGYHRIKQASLAQLYIPESIDTILIDEAHDLTAPMVEILDRSPQTVISLGDQLQNLEGSYIPHNALVRHRDMSISLRAGQPLVHHINQIIELFPAAPSDPFVADKEKEMIVAEYPANSFPPEHTVILVADDWGLFDWLIRSRHMNQSVAVVDWDSSFERFLESCLNLYLRDEKPISGPITHYKTWGQLRDQMMWNDAFVRVEQWLGTVGARYGVSGLYKCAHIGELSNKRLARSLIATVFTVKNFEFSRLTISEDLYYAPDLRGKKLMSKKLALLYTAMTRASGKLYIPESHREWTSYIRRESSFLK